MSPSETPAQSLEELEREVECLRQAGNEAELSLALQRRARQRWRAQGEGQLALAFADLGAALKLTPERAELLCERGCVRAAQGELGPALRDFAQALLLDPSLSEAQRYHRVVSRLHERAQARAGLAAPPPLQATTISRVLSLCESDSFCEDLARYLQASVSAPPGFEDCRDDAIQEVVTRVLEVSSREGQPLAEALRSLRRASTRAWVRDLARRFGQRGRGEALSEDLPARGPAAPPSLGPLRLEELLQAELEEFVAASRISVRWRRRVVWEVFVGGLLGGVTLTRKEVVSALRKLGIPKRKASEGQIVADVDRIVHRLRRCEGPGLPRPQAS